ncbi:uncharacterized protein LOC142975739 isoform X2 [Anticarsia gemmatalis]|uniref:uncharacterized protein LOC142975739 isoform X2 n=1 Tax=Anticarsia gemmatalis TaxID=129554 RepID=UPI003F77490B
MPLIDSTPPPLPANPPPSSVASFAATTMAPELTDASLANTADNAIPPLPPSDTKDKLDETLPKSENDANELPSPVKEDSDKTPADNGVEQNAADEPVLIDNSVRAVDENTKPEIVAIEVTVIENEIKVENKASSAPSSEEPVTEKVEIEIPVFPSQLVEEPTIENEKQEELVMPVLPVSEIAQDSAIETKVIKENSAENAEEVDMPTPPSELLDESANDTEVEKEVSENLELELPAPPAEGDQAIENNESISEVETLPPPTEVSIVPENNVDVLNTVQDLPAPPPPICDEAGDVISENKDVAEKNEIVSDNIQEIMKDAVVYSNHVCDSEKTCPKEVELNDNENLEQNVKNKSKDALGNLIETIECNGNVEEEKLLSDKEVAEIVLPSNPKENANVESGRTASTPDDSMPPSLSGAASNDASDSFPPPPSDLSRSEGDASPDSATPQEPLPVSDKLADLIPEVPEVPELKTDMETTSDVAVAN